MSASTSDLVDIPCWLVGDENMFVIEISAEKKVAHHAKAIKDENPEDFRNVSAKNLMLYKVTVVVDDDMRATLRDIDLATLKPMQSYRTISYLFSEKPSAGSVSVVIVKIPGEPVLGKRSRAADDLEFAMNSKLAKTTPSFISKFSQYRPLQFTDQRLLDDRPKSDPLPPISLLFAGFGEFLDAVNCPKDELNLNLTRLKLEDDVNFFAEEMTQIYSSEMLRRDAGLRALNEILFPRGPLMAAAIGAGRTDGHYDGPHGAASFIVEFKNELCDITSMPMVELTSYVAHSQVPAMERNLDKFQGNRVPCLGMTVVGPYVTFYAIIYVGQWRLVSLTPGLSCITCAGDGGDRKALYAAFSASLTLLDRIEEAGECNVRGLSANVGQGLKFPYISSLPGRGSRSNEEIRFQILGRHPDAQDYRHIFFAQTLDSNKIILVKFTRLYSLQLHEFCASRGRAPTVLGFKEIPGGWSVVAMDYIDPPVHPSDSPNLSRLCDQWNDDLTNLVKAFHEIDLVHGDLRDPNILCDGDEVMLIDFDWGGKEGEAFYPLMRLNPELTHGRYDTSLKISKDDDLRVLRNTFSKLK